jgi:hypothetical protein
LSANQNINNLQFFMTPDEVGGLHAGDYGIGMDKAVHVVRKVAQRKLDEIEDAANRQGGIRQKIRVVHGVGDKPYLMDGHHRAASAIQNNRLVPVKHYGDLEEAKDDTWWDRNHD